MRIDRSDRADGPDDARVAHRAQSVPDDPDTAGKNRDKAVDGECPPGSSPTHTDSALRIERTASYCALVDSVYQQYDIDHGHVRVEKFECQTLTPGTHRIEAEDPEVNAVGPDICLKAEVRLIEVADSKKVETPWAAHGDVPDDPRSYSNPKTGRFDASWSVYDRAIAAAREHAGGDLGPDSIKMYDQNPETEEGTGTLIGEQTPDRLRGWRIDGQDGHVNWWDWTGGKKGAGGAYGHDWFPEDPSAPGSRYIGWAPWQDSDGHILEGN